jgi:integrase
MSRRAKGPRLWRRPARRDSAGQVTHTAAVFILDNGRQFGTGRVDIDAEAEQALAAYIAQKRIAVDSSGPRDTAQIPVADVIELYVRDVVPNLADPKAIAFRLKRINGFFGAKSLAELNGPLCRAYAKKSTTNAMARRDLEDLRAAINHHRHEGLHDRIVSVVLPDRRPPRERWLDRDEAAQWLFTAWRRPRCKQVARFGIIALYTGRRASVVCRASFKREPGRPFVDVRTGMLYPPARARVTKKRNPPIQLPDKLMIHLRAWSRTSRYVVPWGDHSVGRLDRTVKEIGVAAGLAEPVTPHVFRHTAATWQMQSGTDMLEAARYLGMTVRTLESTYAHHRPEHLSGARDAHKRHPRTRPEQRPTT